MMNPQDRRCISLNLFSPDAIQLRSYFLVLSFSHSAIFAPLDPRINLPAQKCYVRPGFRLLKRPALLRRMRNHYLIYDIRINVTRPTKARVRFPCIYKTRDKGGYRGCLHTPLRQCFLAQIIGKFGRVFLSSSVNRSHKREAACGGLL